MRALILAIMMAAGVSTAASAQVSGRGLAPELDAGAPEGAVPTAFSDRPYDRYALPVGAYSASGPEARDLQGRVIWSGFRLGASEISTAEVVSGYRARLTGLGYEPIFGCANAACGGFDFRFSAQLLPPPAMAIDTADFAQFSAARRGGNGLQTFASILVSRLLGVVYIQTVVVASGEPGVAVAPAPEAGGAVQQVVIAQDDELLLARLREFGHVPVQGLVFGTGGAALSEGSAPALGTLAQFLTRNPGLVVDIVGHSDNEGSLESNIALSKRRAEAVRAALVERGVAESRLEAHGAGYLAPVSTNATDAGRKLNRRVELVLR